MSPASFWCHPLKPALVPHDENESKQRDPEGAYLDLSCHQRDCVSDSGAPVHDMHVIAVREETVWNPENYQRDVRDGMLSPSKIQVTWSHRFFNCTCGLLLKESEANRGAIQCTLDLLSVPNCVIKKGRPRGHRYGKTTTQREQYVAHNLRKRCTKRHFQGIHHRFVNDPEFRASQLEHDRDEEVCIKMDELAQKGFLPLHDGIRIFSIQTELVNLSQ